MIDFRTHPRPKAALYRALQRCLDGGLPLPRALSLVQGPGGHPLDHSLRPHLEAGLDLPQSLRAAGICDREETAVLTAAGQSGRLPEALATLARDLEAEEAERRRCLGRLAYPALLLHLVPAAVSTPLLPGSPGRFAAIVLGTWGVFWLAVLGTARGLRNAASTATGRARLAGWPLIGPVLRAGDTLRFLRSLLWLYGSGVPLVDALGRAASSAPANPNAARALARARAGGSLEEVAAEVAGTDPMRRNELVSGAAAGELESALRRAVLQAAEDRQRAVQDLARRAGHLARLAAMVAVAAAAVSVYGRYLRLLGGI